MLKSQPHAQRKGRSRTLSAWGSWSNIPSGRTGGLAVTSVGLHCISHLELRKPRQSKPRGAAPGLHMGWGWGSARHTPLPSETPGLRPQRLNKQGRGRWPRGCVIRGLGQRV